MSDGVGGKFIGMITGVFPIHTVNNITQKIINFLVTEQNVPYELQVDCP